MKKLTAKNSQMYSKVKQFYKRPFGEESDMDVEVVNNLLWNDKAKFKKNLDPKWNKFWKFFWKEQKAYLIVSGNIYQTLKYHYGRCDFKFEGNREYKNYIFEVNGVCFIASSKNEYVTPKDERVLPDAVAEFYYVLFQLTLEYLKAYPNEFCQKYIDKWLKKGELVGNHHWSLKKKVK